MKLANQNFSLPFSYTKGLLNFFGLSSHSRLEQAKDFIAKHSGHKALMSDWVSIGNDLKKSIKLFDEEIKTK